MTFSSTARPLASPDSHWIPCLRFANPTIYNCMRARASVASGLGLTTQSRRRRQWPHRRLRRLPHARPYRRGPVRYLEGQGSAIGRLHVWSIIPATMASACIFRASMCFPVSQGKLSGDMSAVAVVFTIFANKLPGEVYLDSSVSRVGKGADCRYDRADALRRRPAGQRQFRSLHQDAHEVAQNRWPQPRPSAWKPSSPAVPRNARLRRDP